MVGEVEGRVQDELEEGKSRIKIPCMKFKKYFCKFKINMILKNDFLKM